MDIVGNRTPDEEYCSIVFHKETSFLSGLHQLNKTSSTRSKKLWFALDVTTSDNNILLSTLKHQNFARLLLHRSANFFFVFFKLMFMTFSLNNSILKTDWGKRNFQLSIPAGYSLFYWFLYHKRAIP